MKKVIAAVILGLGLSAMADQKVIESDVAFNDQLFNLYLYLDLAKKIKPKKVGNVSTVVLPGLLSCTITDDGGSLPDAQCSMLKGGWTTTTETRGVGVGMYLLAKAEDKKRLYDNLGTKTVTKKEKVEDEGRVYNMITRTKDIKFCVDKGDSAVMTSLNCTWVQALDGSTVVQDLRTCGVFKDYLQPKDACQE